MATLFCPLCNGASTSYHVQAAREFLQCGTCSSVFTNPAHYISPEAEKAHYECHVNIPDNPGYQKFVSPIVNSILHDFKPEDKGLDFGSGTGSPIVKMLDDAGYNISQYDLFFYNHPEVLHKQYDYIACSETAEHFKEPYKEFAQLRNLVHPKGKLYLMTEMFDENRDFGSWYYKTDPTHVFLYHPKAFEWIMNEFGFSELVVNGRLIVLGL